MEDNDSDIGDMLEDLLANGDEENEEVNETENSAPKKTLTELPVSFLDIPNEDSKKSPTSSASVLPDGLNSDDEDDKYFEEQKYNQSGKEIRNLLKKQEFDNQKSESGYGKSVNANWKKNLGLVPGDKTADKVDEKTDKISKIDQKKAGLMNKWLNTPTDVYADPIFGLRIVKPLVSSAQLKENMRDKRSVLISRIKPVLSELGKSEIDWVIAGVLLIKTVKKSKSGKQYLLWTLSDLSPDMPTITVFLFSQAYKEHWKLQSGTVVGILNPSILESRNDKDQATLSVDRPQKIMILGNSKDLGRCKSMKKNGDSCTNFVNVSRCEYCIYHVKQEYNKASRRSDLQTDKNSRKFSNQLGGKINNYNSLKNSGMYSQQVNQIQQNTPVIPARKCLKMEKKDQERLALLRGNDYEKPVECSAEEKKKSFLEMAKEQAKTNADRLNVIRGLSDNPSVTSSKVANSPSTSSNLTASIRPSSFKDDKQTDLLSKITHLPSPKLGSGSQNGFIDFSEPISTSQIKNARLNAIKLIKEKGGLKASNPNKIGESREKIKRKREEMKEGGEQQGEEPKEKRNCLSDKFKQLLNAESSHKNLIEQADNNEQEKYFKKLEIKEGMEEKMAQTFKVPCKAVKCLICKYVNFSASDLCKEKRHPLRVEDAIKRFFKCLDCGNRTVSLNILPTNSCKKCSGSKWIKAPMMKEKNCLPDNKLSIRGGEQKFVGSDITNSSLDLLMPDE